MATVVQAKRLPYGIGQFSLGWLLVIAALLVLVGLGVYAYSRQLTEGEIVTGMRDVGVMGGAPWGLYIVFELYAVGVGFGSMILLALIRLARLSHLQPLTRTLGLTALAALLVGALSVIADVGQPLRAIVNIARYGRPMSPFFGTFTVGVVTSLLTTWVYLYLDSRRDAALLARDATRWQGFLRFIAAGYRDTPQERQRHQQTSLVLAVLLLVSGVVAASTSGFVFGVQLGRAGWYSALQAPSFVVLAGVTATGLLIMVAAALQRVLGGEQMQLNLRVFVWLSNMMTVLSLVYLYFLAAELLTSSYVSHHHEEELLLALLTGQYAWIFWVSGSLLLAAFLIGAAQAISGRYALPLMVLAGLLVNLAAIGKRYLIVVPSLTMGNLLPYGPGSYSPTWVEYAVIAGLFALGALLYLIFMKVFPILELPERPAGGR
ncbi:MAG: polysulfide reductase NrfD [Chloroflexi bacterium]|nr:polysulfide reductase NrfD [Chloroflexota bacterium]